MKKTNALLSVMTMALLLAGCTGGSSSEASSSEASSSTSSSETSSTPSSSEVSSASSSSSSEASSSASSSSEALPSFEETGDGFYKPTEFAFTGLDYQVQAETFVLESTGTQKLLVIPVEFTDYPASALDDQGGETTRQKIQDLFFGEAEDTAWESVSSFYEKSSYGALNLAGTVTPWFQSGMTAEEFATLEPSGDYADYYEPTWSMGTAAIEWYKQYTGSDLKEFDQNSDGFIDAVWMVYSAPNQTNGVGYSADVADVMWAYVYWNYNNYNAADVDDPKPFTYGWASYDFMYEGYGDTQIDAHTFIHETGHLMGLDDYYTYDGKSDWGAAGAIDMMDNNVADHNGYSKMYLDWILPTVIDGTKNSVTLTMTPFQDSGDVIIIGNDWNGSAFDEYLMLEFYTPTGLNEKDSTVRYSNNRKAMTQPGIKLYHIDSRLGKYNYNTGAYMGYTDTLSNGTGAYAYIAQSNTASRSQDSTHKLVHLIEGNGSFFFKSSQSPTATNSTLFQAGDSFNPTTFAKFFNGGKMNDGSDLRFSFTVDAMSATEATVTFRRLK